MTTSGNEAQPLREEDSFDVSAVNEALKRSLPDLKGTPSVGQFVGGASNLTYALDYSDRWLVLRRPPKGPKPKSGHSMIREYRVMKALKPLFPTVPEVVYYTNDEDSVLGAEFYVMNRVEGVILGKTIPDEWNWSSDDVRQFCEKFWTLLVDLHAVDYDKVGLSDFGRPEGYVSRQVSGWNRRFEQALTPDAHPFEDVRGWIEANAPPDTPRSSLLHGDYRIDNLILNADDPMKIEAVLDWELAALGDPLMDLGSALAYWIEPGDPEGLRPLEKQPSRSPGMLTRKEIVKLYSEKSGIAIDDFTFYYVFGLFRLAVIAQQIYRRYHEGATTNPAFKDLGKGAMGLFLYCQSLISEGMQ